MNRFFFLVAMMFLPMAGYCQPGVEHTAHQNHDRARSSGLLNLADAEAILGEPARLADSATSVQPGRRTYRCAYLAAAADRRSGRRGNLYFVLEQFDKAAAARDKYAAIRRANEPHGIQTLQGLGDEAYFHSDNVNFYFVMVRKGSKVANMKVNKITSNTSLKEFNRTAREIAAAL